jgi:hypothetical protein
VYVRPLLLYRLVRVFSRYETEFASSINRGHVCETVLLSGMVVYHVCLLKPTP